MPRIKNETQYQVVMTRVEELLSLVSNEDPVEEKLAAEIDLLSELAEQYEKEHYPITPPSICEILRYAMMEQNLSQRQTAEILGVSQSRVSEYMNGRAEPTLKVARIMCKQLHISPSLMLGVI